jgi:hypothetical protein
MVTSVGYSDYDGYIGDIYFGTYMDRKRKGLLPEQQGTLFDDEYNDKFHYRAAATAETPCSKQRMGGMPEDMRKEYRMLPSTYTTLPAGYKRHIADLAADEVEAVMQRQREQQRLRTAAVDKKLASMSQLEKELAILNWEI